MYIDRITQDQHDTLLNLYNKGSLVFIPEPFRGRQYLDPKKLTDEDKEDIKTISEILKTSVKGFTGFLNFVPSTRDVSKAKPSIRLEYNYCYRPPNEKPDELGSFTGVGYVKIDELFNGFEN